MRASAAVRVQCRAPATPRAAIRLPRVQQRSLPPLNTRIYSPSRSLLDRIRRRAYATAPIAPVNIPTVDVAPVLHGAPEQLSISLRGEKLDISSALYDGPVPLPSTSLQNQAANLFDWWQPVQVATGLLERWHDFTGLPWWLTISSMALMMRAALLPTNLLALQNAGNLERAKPEMELLNMQRAAQAGQRAAGEGLHALAMQQMAVKNIWTKHNVKYWKMLLPAVAGAPFFITFFLTLRRMALQEPDWVTGGVLWFTDLSVPDPYARLPIMSSILMVTAVQLGQDGSPAAKDRNKLMMMFIRGAILFSTLFTMWFPQGLHIYWITNTAASIVISLICKLPAVRRKLGWPDVYKPSMRPVFAPQATSRPVTTTARPQAPPAQTP